MLIVIAFQTFNAGTVYGHFSWS